MTKLRTRFRAFGRTFTFTLDTEKLSRNYNDEHYAYWICSRNEHVFEINIWKAPTELEQMAFTDKGLVNCYKDEPAFGDDKLSEEHAITFHKA